MFQDIFTEITNIPALIQAVIGSALFAILLRLGQKAYAKILDKATHVTKTRRRKYLLEEIAKLEFATADDYSKGGAFISILIYRSLRSLFKALVWLALGLLSSSIDPVFGIVGYVGALYYFFEGLNTVGSPAKVDDKVAKLNELKVELAALKRGAAEEN